MVRAVIGYLFLQARRVLAQLYLYVTCTIYTYNNKTPLHLWDVLRKNLGGGPPPNVYVDFRPKYSKVLPGQSLTIR